MALDAGEVGARIKRAREARGWTHDDFREALRDFQGEAKAPGLRTVQRWQTGVKPDGTSWLPRLKTLMDIADLFELPRSYFVEAEAAPVTMVDLQEELSAVREEIAALRADLQEEREPDGARGAHRRGRKGPGSAADRPPTASSENH